MDSDTGAMIDVPLSAAGVNFSDPDQASDFLAKLLNDDELKVIGNQYATFFWYGIAATIGLASIFHWTRWIILHWRLRDAARKRRQPAKPKNICMRWFATFTALAREATYLQFTPTKRYLWFRVPPMGTIMLILAYLAFVLVLEFINDSITGAQFWQARGIRAGWLAVAQVPLLILLAGRHNLISMFTGVSHERLNVLHRWSSRMILLMVIFHFAMQSTAWNFYGLRQLEWSTDSCPTTGIAAFAILLWMNLSTLAPLRSWSYEFFVVQHLMTFFGFIVAVMFHLPTTALSSRIYIYIPIGLYVLDRVIRIALFTWTNFRITNATLTAMNGGVTRVRMTNLAIKKWNPGSYVLLSIPHFGVLQYHPATIASTPLSHNGDLVFLLKCHKGFTQRIMHSASNSATALLSRIREENEDSSSTNAVTYTALLQGPYGGAPFDYAAFDSVCLIAGSSGVTFILALLQDIADRVVSGDVLPIRRIHFVWCVKDTNWVSWASDEITSAYNKISQSGIDIKVSIYVTCIKSFSGPTTMNHVGCKCDKNIGPCCCTSTNQTGTENAELILASLVKAKNDATASIDEKDNAMASSSDLVSHTTAPQLSQALPCALFYSGRPEISSIISSTLAGAEGESGIAVCGPIGLSSAVRNSVVKASDQRAIHKGTGSQGCYLHVESFS